MPVNINPCHYICLRSHYHGHHHQNPTVTAKGVQVSNGEVWAECRRQNSAHCSWLGGTVFFSVFHFKDYLLALVHAVPLLHRKVIWLRVPDINFWRCHIHAATCLLSLWGRIILCGQGGGASERMTPESSFPFYPHCSFTSIHLCVCLPIFVAYDDLDQLLITSKQTKVRMATNLVDPQTCIYHKVFLLQV